MTEKSSVAVIIPAINEAKLIGEAIDSAWRGGAAEVIVVDGGSTDQTVPVAESHRARVLRTAPGRGQQLNVGAAASTSDILQFLHADCQLPESFAQDIRRAGPDHDVGMYRQQIDAHGIAFRMLEYGNLWRVQIWNLAYGDQGIWVRRGTFEALGRFPEVALMEDYIFSSNLPKQMRYHVLPSAIRVSSRRWDRNGVFWQTIRNQRIIRAYRRGRSVDELMAMYRRHDSPD